MFKAEIRIEVCLFRWDLNFVAFAFLAEILFGVRGHRVLLLRVM